MIKFQYVEFDKFCSFVEKFDGTSFRNKRRKQFPVHGRPAIRDLPSNRFQINLVSLNKRGIIRRGKRESISSMSVK